MSCYKCSDDAWLLLPEISALSCSGYPDTDFDVRYQLERTDGPVGPNGCHGDCVWKSANITTDDSTFQWVLTLHADLTADIDLWDIAANPKVNVARLRAEDVNCDDAPLSRTLSLGFQIGTCSGEWYASSKIIMPKCGSVVYDASECACCGNHETVCCLDPLPPTLYATGAINVGGVSSPLNLELAYGDWLIESCFGLGQPAKAGWLSGSFSFGTCTARLFIYCDPGTTNWSYAVPIVEPGGGGEGCAGCGCGSSTCCGATCPDDPQGFQIDMTSSSSGVVCFDDNSFIESLVVTD